MKRRFHTILLGMLLVICFAVPAFGSGISDTHGISMRAIALGGAFTAVADNYAAAYYNPAGLAQGTGNVITIEYLHIAPNIDVETLDGQDLTTPGLSGLGGQNETRNDPTEASYDGLEVPAPFVGIILDINEIVPTPVPVRVGVALSFPEHFEVCYAISSYAPDQPHFIRFGDDINRVTLAVGAGAELIDNLLYVGGGIQAMTYGNGSAYPQQEANAQGEDVSNTYEASLFRVDPLAGILITPLDGKVKVGLSWRDEEFFQIPMETSASQGFQGIINQYTGLPLPVEIPGGLDINLALDIECFYTPEEYSLGFAFDIGKALVSLEANKQLWSNYDFSTSQKVYYEGSPDFKDTINYRAGVEYMLGETSSLMVGYCYQPTPVPDQSGRVTNYLDMDKKIFSIGLNKTIDDPINIVKDGKINLVGTFQYLRLDDYTVYKDGVSGPTWEEQESYRVEGDAYAGGIAINIAW